MTVFGVDDGVFEVFRTLVLMEREIRTEERHAEVKPVVACG